MLLTPLHLQLFYQRLGDLILRSTAQGIRELWQHCGLCTSCLLLNGRSWGLEVNKGGTLANTFSHRD